jgi:hypothetical protein
MKIVFDKVMNKYYVLKKEMIYIGKLSWVIDKKFDTRTEASNYIKTRSNNG